MNSKQNIFISFLLTILVSMSLLIIFGDNGYIDRNRMKKILNNLHLDNERLGDENLEFYRRINRLKTDPEYVKSIAKQKLGLLAADEIILKPRD